MKPSKIHKNLFYIVDTKYPKSPKLLWNEFQTHEEAHETIIEYLHMNVYRFFVIKGVDAYLHDITRFKPKAGNLREPNFRKINKVKLLKYRYPPSRVSLQQRKTYRTIIRRKIKATINQK